MKRKDVIATINATVERVLKDRRNKVPEDPAKAFEAGVRATQATLVDSFTWKTGDPQ